jgi:hypothetical protein
MRCYFIKGGHIASVEELLGLSDEEARYKSHQLFLERTYQLRQLRTLGPTRAITRFAKPADPEPETHQLFS